MQQPIRKCPKKDIGTQVTMDSPKEKECQAMKDVYTSTSTVESATACSKDAQEALAWIDYKLKGKINQMIYLALLESRGDKPKFITAYNELIVANDMVPVKIPTSHLKHLDLLYVVSNLVKSNVEVLDKVSERVLEIRKIDKKTKKDRNLSTSLPVVGVKRHQKRKLHQKKSPVTPLSKLDVEKILELEHNKASSKPVNIEQTVELISQEEVSITQLKEKVAVPRSDSKEAM